MGSNGATGSGIKAVGVQPISNVACFLTGVTVLTDGTNEATLILYDNAANSETGTVVEKIIIPGASRYGGRDYSVPRRCVNGLTANLSGTGANCIIDYV